MEWNGMEGMNEWNDNTSGPDSINFRPSFKVTITSVRQLDLIADDELVGSPDLDAH